jgi:hypothetical protein
VQSPDGSFRPADDDTIASVTAAHHRGHAHILREQVLTG